MNTAEELIEQAYELEPGNIAQIWQWCNAVRTCLGVRDIGAWRCCTSVAFPFDALYTATEMRLAYILGRTESDNFAALDNHQRKQRQGANRKAGRLREGAIPTEEYKAEVSAYGNRLKSQGIRNFRKLTADHFNETPKNVTRWMKRGPA